MSVKREWCQMVSDFYKYLDTTPPKGVDKEIYMYMKYNNRDKLQRFKEEHGIDVNVLEKIAVHELMKLPDKDILLKLEEVLCHAP